DAVGAALARVAYRLARQCRRVDARLDRVEEGIDVQTWRDDLVGLAAALHVRQPFNRLATAQFTRGGDAVGEPQLEDVFRWHALAVLVAMQMHVRIDEARQQGETGAVDLTITRCRAPAGINAA